MKKKNAIISCCVLIAAVLTGCEGGYKPEELPPPPTDLRISALKTITKLASTVAPNGDANPYGIATPPSNYTGINPTTLVKNILQPGDILISNFSDITGANNGTTIMRFVPSTGAISPYYQESKGAGPVALALSNLGALWIANFKPGYSSPLTGATTGDGNVVVVTQNGTDFPNNAGLIDNNSGATFNPSNDRFSGPWGQVFAVKTGTTTPFFFVTEVISGAIQRQQFIPGKFNVESVTTIGRLPTGTNALDPTGPQGLAYDPDSDTLYVASTADNSIVAYANATTTAFESPSVIFRGNPLNAPVGLAISPINGNLLVANQLDNNLVEIQPNLAKSTSATQPFPGVFVASKLLDPTPVDVIKGTGSALFGVLPVKDTNGKLLIYFVNANTNSLNVLKD